MLKILSGAAIFAALSIPAKAQDSSPFHSPEFLASIDFVPFAVSNASGASFGMQREGLMYLCFVMDTAENAATRTQIISENWGDKDGDKRFVPHFRSACVKVE